MDITSIKNDALIAAFEAMRAETNDKTKTDFFNEVRKATYVTSAILDKLPQKRADGSFKIEPDTTISFKLIQNKNGDKYFPAFTDLNELRKSPDSKESQAVTVSFADYTRFLANNTVDAKGIVINPFTQNIIIPKEIIQQIAGAKMVTTVKEMRIDKPTSIQLGAPNKQPVEMLDKIKNLLVHNKNVAAAYLRLMKMNEVFSFLIIVDFEKGEDKSVYEDIAKAAVPYLNGIHIQMIPKDSELGRKATENVEPFYTKKRKFFR
ncbi:MAG: enhanced serine sensitivity protein SseB [Ruminiclostridium sp.]